ncbi:hypothetical protein GCM10022378_09180 [Salinicoccus jeotgali]|uniref:Streptococcin A-M57 n=1 Tax=Salinicoccus jeotgali TaxID=381634 RepID=A0ABP7ENM0_9STAP
MYKKIILSLAIILIASSGILSNVTMASEVENFTEEEVKEVAKEMQFYFEEVGKLDKNGNYTIHDYELLKERADSGDETAQGVLAQANYEAQQTGITTYGIVDYSKCILANYFSTEIAAVNGDLANAIAGAVERGAWMEVARIVLSSIGGSVGKANVVATAGQLVMYTAYCGGQQVT